MNIITQLSATAVSQGEFREPRGILTTVHAEPVNGVHIKVQLGGAGLVLRRGDVALAFPLEVLIAAAIEKCPQLVNLSPSPGGEGRGEGG
jgi:hypothetical protein